MAMDEPPTDLWDRIWLPRRPLATDDPTTGLTRTSRTLALDRRLIETNPAALTSLLAVDVDHPDALIRALWDRADWLPTVVTENPGNGHAHAIWALTAPVATTEYAHRRPLALAAAVTEGLRRSVDGDPAFGGLITKNPLNQDWIAHWVTSHTYGLRELAGHLDDADLMPPASWRRARRRNPVGLGRNCCLFETARTWAYREARHHWGDPDGLHRAITSTVRDLNQNFSDPLPSSETRAIATSIHKWITTKSRIWKDGPATYEATFITIQSARGKKSRASRWSASEKRIEDFLS
jgi:replicase